MHQLAFGEMDMTPFEYYTMLPREFAAKVEGYSRKIYRKSSEQRRAAFIIISPHIKDLPYERFCRDFWPLEMDNSKVEESSEPLTASPEIWASIRKQQNLNDYENILKEHNKKLSNQRRAKK